MTASQAARRAPSLVAAGACLAALAVGGCMTGPAGGFVSPSMATSPAVAAALQAALDNNRSGVAQPWQDPLTGLGGSILPMRTFRTTSGLICRDYTVIVVESAGTRTEDGTACRDSDGLWKDAG